VDEGFARDISTRGGRMVVLKVVRDRKEGPTSLCFYRNIAPPRLTVSAGDTVVHSYGCGWAENDGRSM
jgi:hypothetical protein